MLSPNSQRDLTDRQNTMQSLNKRVQYSYRAHMFDGAVITVGGRSHVLDGHYPLAKALGKAKNEASEPAAMSEQQHLPRQLVTYALADAPAEAPAGTTVVAMPHALQLSGRPVTYSEAASMGRDVLNGLELSTEDLPWYHYLWSQQTWMEELLKSQLGLGKKDVCRVPPPGEWIRGAFNVCIPVTVVSGDVVTKYVIRCPLPHRLVTVGGDSMSSEVGAYVWMQEKCPDIPIPRLIGFGFADGRQIVLVLNVKFTHVAQRSFFVRVVHALRRSIHSLFRLPMLSQYTYIPDTPYSPTAYLLMEHVGSDGAQMLCNTMAEHKEDPERRQNLFRGLTRIMLSLARIPQPRIGSFRFHHDGTVSLSNRYLSCSLALMERDGVPRTTEPDDLHCCTESLVSDMLEMQNRRFLTQPNAVLDEDSCHRHMAVLTLLRAVSRRYIKRDRRCGPYLLHLTDLNSSNIFVDDEWNVKHLVDLQWICAAPAEMLDVPWWLTGLPIDEIVLGNEVAFDKVRREFMDVLKTEEQEMKMEHDIPIYETMQETWDSKGWWFWHCLTSGEIMSDLFEDHLCPSGPVTNSTWRVVSEHWGVGRGEVVRRKVADKEEYDDVLEDVFRQ
ncbi:hypothetical protein HJFPF1_05144 [Paramyrothecium foliicola]|nr:hypothetical protein HJFPF1_05144 [Paramyrothecium foliicola]